ncbi:hypothetical protein [Magnetospirillum fulvum]|uniref:hypothetical protein n=1 Tax=Magnetospirillum fulvum TaxID=1082 RepID=UPI001E31D524|nr:hypothetical protein [Magnetospirillum fulvum]
MLFFRGSPGYDLREFLAMRDKFLSCQEVDLASVVVESVIGQRRKPFDRIRDRAGKISRSAFKSFSDKKNARNP